MSAPFNSGTITLNKSANSKATEIIEKHLGRGRYYEIDNNVIEIYEIQDYSFEDVLIKLADDLREIGYTMSGSISYYGDYDGRIDIDEDGVENIPIEDTALHDASDEELIGILEGRGYIVTKRN